MWLHMISVYQYSIHVGVNDAELQSIIVYRGFEFCLLHYLLHAILTLNTLLQVGIQE